MKATSKISAGLCLCGLIAVASIAAAQVSVNAPPAGAAGPTNVQAGPINVQTAPGGGTSVTVPPGTGGAVGQRVLDNSAARQDNRMDRRAERRGDAADWRMVRHNNQWWYWGPNNTWSVYRNNAWTPYNDGSAAAQPSYAARRPFGLRRWSTGYRGTAPAFAPPASLPAPPATTLAPSTPAGTMAPTTPATTAPAPATTAPVPATAPPAPATAPTVPAPTTR